MAIERTEREIMERGVPGCFGSVITLEVDSELCQRCRSRDACKTAVADSASRASASFRRAAVRCGAITVNYQMTLSALAQQVMTALQKEGRDPIAELANGRNPFEIERYAYMRLAGELLLEGRYSRETLRRLIQTRHPDHSRATVRRYATVADEIVRTLNLRAKSHA